MSTNKTQNYNLHKWEADDDFLRTEFNENFAKIDAQAVRIITGTYTGSQGQKVSTPQHIELGVRPRAVIISSNRGLSYTPINYTDAYSMMGSAEFDSKGALVCEENGFSASNRNNDDLYPNVAGWTYYFIALL